MKLTKLNESVAAMDGKPFKVEIGREVDENGAEKIDPKTKEPIKKTSDKIRQFFGFMLGELRGTGAQRMLAYDLGVKILKSDKDEIEVTKEEVELLKIALEGTSFTSTLYAQLFKCIVE